MKQLLYNMYFNLRKSKASKPTNINCVVYMNGKQYYFATGVKILPCQWDKKRQIAVISNVQSRIENYNNKIVNDKLEELKEQFTNFLEYLCKSEDKPSYYLLRSFMIKSANIKAAELITKAYEYKYAGTTARKNYMSRLNAFLKYLKEQRKTSLDVFTQAGFNEYVKYLKDKGASKSAINADCQLIERLIGKVLAVESPFLEYGISPVIYNKEKDIRPDKGRFALEEYEVERITNLKINEQDDFSFEDVVRKDKNGKVNPKYRSHKNGRELAEYRDIFVLQCRCGQRVSDLVLFLKGEVTTIVVGGQIFYELKTKKSQKKESAFILQDDYILSFQKRYANGFIVDVDNLDSNNSYYNLAIRKLCKLAGIDRIITYRNPQDEECKQPVYEKITSHDARHTFITIMLKKGFAPDRLCWMTGHRDDTMIKQIYSHLTSNDKAKALAEEIEKVGDPMPVTNLRKDVLERLFLRSCIIKLSKQEKDGLFVYRDASITDIKATINNVDHLDELVDEVVTSDNYEELKQECKNLYEMVWAIGRYDTDIEMFRRFQYKLYRLGVIKKEEQLSIETINREWHRENFVLGELEDMMLSV